MKKVSEVYVRYIMSNNVLGNPLAPENGFNQHVV